MLGLSFISKTKMHRMLLLAITLKVLY